MYHGSLATVGPWEALVTFQQFLILADRLGVVDMTAEVIARISTVPLEIIAKGIAVLEKPDPHSRNDAEGGARLKRISEHRDWGWQIVNHAHYRAIRSAEERRDYMREQMREKRKVLPKAPEGFAEFWIAYPRKVGKGTAEKAWLKIAPDAALVDAIVAAAIKQQSCEQWQREGGKFIPHPTTWLNRKGWLDEAVSINYGTCKFCPEPATAISKHGVPHCAKARHIDQANGR